jgi:hypothetical protein
MIWQRNDEIAALRAEVLDLRRLLGPYSTVETALKMQSSIVLQKEELQTLLSRVLESWQRRDELCDCNAPADDPHSNSCIWPTIKNLLGHGPVSEKQKDELGKCPECGEA